MFKIPNEIFTIYHEVCEELINNENIGVNVTLVYPPDRIPCDCGSEKDSSHFIKNKISLGINHCPKCNNNGYIDIPKTELIRLRCYWTQQEWKKIVPSIEIPEGHIMCIGFVKDKPKVEAASSLVVNNKFDNSTPYNFVLAGETFPWGFGKDRYFVGRLRRA